MKTLEWTPKCSRRAFGLIEAHWHSLSEINQITNIPDKTLRSLRKRNNPLNKVQSGHPLKLSPHHKRHIVFHITRNHESCCLSTISIIQDLQLDICITQLKHALKDLGYNHRIAWHWPFLKRFDRKRCLQFARHHAHFTMEDWKAFNWTDEMSVKVGMQRSTRDWVWRMDNEEFHPDCSDYRKCATGTGMMFWGAFRWDAVCFLNWKMETRWTLPFIETKSWKDHFRSSGRSHLEIWKCPLSWKIMPLLTRRWVFLSEKSLEWSVISTLQTLLISIQLRTFGHIWSEK